jgi:NADH-ubiquinone oxidoreductase chain 5
MPVILVVLCVDTLPSLVVAGFNVCCFYNILIISPNIISILLGWDGLGLVSYLLVIYYQNVKSNGAAMLAVLSNRIGDVALLMVIAWIINFGSWSFIYYLEFLLVSVEIELISFLLV